MLKLGVSSILRSKRLKNTSKLSPGYWSNESVQREALAKLGREKFGVKELDDWYSVKAANVRKELVFIRTHHGSFYKALKNLYPHHKWDPLRFTKVPRGCWSDENTQKDALEKLGIKLGVKKLDDWYSILSEDVECLSFITDYYNGSLCDALKVLYPQHNWDPLKFSRVPNGFWTDENSQREALERLGLELGVKELDDWYSIPSRDVHTKLSFVKNYGSMFNTLKTLYPHHNWNPLRFFRAPNGYWQQTETVQHYHEMFTQWKQQHSILTVGDWHQLPPQQVKLFKHAARGIFGSKMKMLGEWFPETIWHAQFTTQFELCGLVRLVMEGSTTRYYITDRGEETNHFGSKTPLPQILQALRQYNS